MSAALGAVGPPGLARAQTRAFPGIETSPQGRTRTANTFLAASQAPADFSLPAELESIPFDPRTGFDLPIGGFQPTFIPRAGLLGPGGDPTLLLREPMIMGLVVTCLKDIWWIESAPAGSQAFTMVAYAEAGATGASSRMAVLTGQGTVEADEGRGVTFALQTVPRLAGSDRHDQITATVAAKSDGSYEGQVEVIAEKHKSGDGHGKCHRRCEGKSKTGQRRCKRRCRKHT